MREFNKRERKFSLKNNNNIRATSFLVYNLILQNFSCNFVNFQFIDRSQTPAMSSERAEKILNGFQM